MGEEPIELNGVHKRIRLRIMPRHTDTNARRYPAQLGQIDARQRSTPRSSKACSSWSQPVPTSLIGEAPLHSPVWTSLDVASTVTHVGAVPVSKRTGQDNVAVPPLTAMPSGVLTMSFPVPPIDHAVTGHHDGRDHAVFCQDQVFAVQHERRRRITEHAVNLVRRQRTIPQLHCGNRAAGFVYFVIEEASALHS